MVHIGLTITELGRDNINAKNAEKYTSKFLHELDEVETELSRVINYLGQVKTRFNAILFNFN